MRRSSQKIYQSKDKGEDPNNSNDEFVPHPPSPQQSTTKLKDTVDLLVDLLPVLHEANTRRSNSRLGRSRSSIRRYHEQHEADRILQHYPLHRACATFDFLQIRRILCASSLDEDEDDDDYDYEDKEDDEEYEHDEERTKRSVAPRRASLGNYSAITSHFDREPDDEHVLARLHETMRPTLETPLHVACRYNAPPEIIHYLLHVERQCFNNIYNVHNRYQSKKSFLFKSSAEGYLPLHMATKHGSVDAVRVLLEAEEEVFLLDSNNDNNGDPIGTEPVATTAAIPINSKNNNNNQQRQMQPEQLRSRCHVSAIYQSTKDGNTPLHLAVCQDNIDIVRLLLEAEETLMEMQQQCDDCCQSKSAASPPMAFLPSAPLTSSIDTSKTSLTGTSVTHRGASKPANNRKAANIRKALIYNTNAAGLLPLHLALFNQTRINKLELWSLLLDADKDPNAFNNNLEVAALNDLSSSSQKEEQPRRAMKRRSSLGPIAVMTFNKKRKPTLHLPFRVLTNAPSVLVASASGRLEHLFQHQKQEERIRRLSALQSTKNITRQMTERHLSPTQQQQHPEQTAFQFFLHRPHQLTQQFVETYLATDVLENFLQGHHISTFNCLKIHRSIAHNVEMQKIMNEACSNRIPVMTFMADFYAHCISLLVFYVATRRYLRDQEAEENAVSSALEAAMGSNRSLADGDMAATTTTTLESKHEFISYKKGSHLLPWDIIAMYVLSAYFLLRGLLVLISARKSYWKDLWNYVDMVKIALILVSAQIFQREFLSNHGDEKMEPDIHQNESTVRQILLCTGIFIYFGAIAFLRATFLPFSLFVGGAIQIMKTVVPFLVCLAMALGCIAYGFWVGGFSYPGDDYELPNGYGEWLFGVFLTALSGPAEYLVFENGFIDHYLWTIIFAVLIQILLLNVLIAIITSEWERITSRQAEVFWNYRLQFAAGVLPVKRFLVRIVMSVWPLGWVLQAIARAVDRLDDTNILDSIEWDVYPYSVVTKDPTKRLYWDRSALIAHLERKTSQQATAAAAFQGTAVTRNLGPVILRDWDEELGVIRSFEADFIFSATILKKLWVICRLIAFAIGWILCFVLGCLSLGLLWPRRVRRFFYGPTRAPNDGEEDDNIMSPQSATGGTGDQASLEKNAKNKEAHHYQAVEHLRSKVDGMAHQMEDLHSKLDKLTMVMTLAQSKTELDWLESRGPRGSRSSYRSSKSDGMILQSFY